MLYMKLFLLNFNDFTINEKYFRLHEAEYKVIGAEIIWLVTDLVSKSAGLRSPGH